MTLQDKLYAIQRNTPKIRQVGMDEKLRMMWEYYQDGGARDDYHAAFAGERWTTETFKPIYDMTPKYATSMFQWMNMYWDDESEQKIEPLDLVALLDAQGVKIDFSKCKQMFWAFSAANISHVGVIDFKSVQRAESFYDKDGNEWPDGNSHECNQYIWRACFHNSFITKIDKLIFNKFNPSFDVHWLPPSLEDVTCEGVIVNGGLDFSICPNITRDSIMQFINVLADFTSEEYAGYKDEDNCFITLGGKNTAKLSATDIAVATNKGWTVK